MVTRCSFLFLGMLLVGGCFQQDNNKVSRILPPNTDYRQSYVQVRGCRLAPAHNSRFILVRASDANVAQAYNAGNCPLPPNGVLVSEESERPDCSKTVGFTVMYKDNPGYDPNAADWHWQELDDQRTVLKDGRVQSCIDCHAQCAATRQTDYTCSSP